jgi:hypothetical protein
VPLERFAVNSARWPSFTSGTFRKTKVSGHRLGNIGKAFATANAPGLDVRPESENRHMLACVIGSAKCRIVPMIGGENREISRTQQSREFREAHIERLKRSRIARHIAPMSVVGIEIDKIRESETAIRQRFRHLKQPVKQDVIARRFDFLACMAMGEDIANLA